MRSIRLLALLVPLAASCGDTGSAELTDGDARSSEARSDTGLVALSGPERRLVSGMGEPPVSGTLRIPAFLARFKETPDSLLADPGKIASLYTVDSLGSVRAYYREVSDGRLDLEIDVDRGWRTLPFRQDVYSRPDFGAETLLRHVVDSVQADAPAYDWGQYDNDGPDGRPNSGDDDGMVDALIIMHSELGKECTPFDPKLVNHLQSSRRLLSLISQQYPRGYPTHSRRATRGLDSMIAIDVFIIMAGQGGDDGCTAGPTRATGAVTHELGHVLGIPELYDNDVSVGPGIGRWGLMGLGGIQTPARPVGMSGWTLSQLGWITQVVVETDTVLDLRPIEVSDTAYVIPISGTHEYLLLSNRQAIGVDSSVVMHSPYGGVLSEGLLVWHVDSLLMRERGFGDGSCWKQRATLCESTDESLRNRVNVGSYPGLVLEQADGRLAAFPGTFNPYDSAAANPGAALSPEGATSFEYPSVVRVDVLEPSAAAANTGTVRLRITFQGDRPLTVGSPDLPNGKVGQAYSSRFNAPGEEAPRWAVVQGRLPAGLALDPGGGTLSGTPTEAGTFPIVIRASSGERAAQFHAMLQVAAAQ
jgi:M6 family metalloprotease-like protein